MSKNGILRDRAGRVLGRTTTDATGRTVLTDYAGRHLGSYDAQSDRTRDYAGRHVGFGNLLGTLLGSDPSAKQ